MGYSDAYPGGYASGGALVTSLLIETDPDTWYDATDALISGTIIRGRQAELDQFAAGTCDVLLSNDDRTFDPTYTSSPLDGHILPMKRVKILATWDGVQYPLFAGYADRWTQHRDGPHRGTTGLTATDGFKVLERARLSSSAYASEVAADGPVAWWRLNEQGGTVAYDTVGDVDLAAVGTPVFGEETLVARDPGSSVSLPTGADGLLNEGPLPVTAGPLTIEVVAKVTSEDVIAGSITHVMGTGFLISSEDGTGFAVATAAGQAVTDTPAGGLDDNLTHHLVGVWNADNSLKLYVDGVDATVGTPSLTIAAFTATTGHTFIGNPLNLDSVVGLVDEVALYDHALTPTRIAAHAEAVSTPWDGDLPGERIERVLDAVGWPAADRDIDPGVTVLQSATLDQTALEHIHGVAATEFGNVYVTAAGILRFEDRASSVDQPVVFEFSDAAGTDLPVTYSAPEISDEHIRNDVTVSRLEGVAQTVTDSTSIAAYQISSYVRDGLYHDDDQHSRYLAQFILEAYKDPVERVTAMTVNPYRDPDDLWPAILGLELTDRITLEETPQHVTPAVTRTLVVEGISHSFGPKTWEASFNVSESKVATQAYWQLGVAGYSELGETTRLYF